MPDPINQPDPVPEGTEKEPVAGESSFFSHPGRSRVRDVVYMVILVAVIGSVVVLLASANARAGLLKRVASSWHGVTGTGEHAEIFALPAPPPKSVEPKIVYQGNPQAGFIGQGTRPPVVITAPAEGEEEAAAEDPTKPPPPPEKTDASKAAYESLLARSPVAQKIASGGFEGYTFKEWRPRRNAPPEFWLDIVATGPDGREALFVWVVNTESGTVEARSQNARDAERRAK